MEILGDFAFSSGIGKSEMDTIIREYLGYFANKYLFIYYQNLDTGTLSVKVGLAEKAAETLAALEKSDDFMAGFSGVIERYIHEEDRQKVINAFNPDWIKESLAAQTSTDVYYRWNTPEGYRYNRLEITKLEGEAEAPRRIIITCENVDKEVQTRISMTENERRYQSGIYALSREYDSVYYVNLDKGEVYPYNISTRIEGMFGNEFYKRDYEQSIDLYIEKAVLEREKKKMRYILSPENIIKKLKKDDYFTKVYLNNENKYTEMKCVKIVQEDGAHVVVMGFAVKDSEIREDRERRQKFAIQFSLLEGLTHEYKSVWRVPPNRKVMLFRSHSDDVYYMNKIMDLEGKDLDKAILAYINKYVSEDDREHIKRIFSYDAIMNSIPPGKVLSHTYKKIDPEGEERFIQALFTKTDNFKNGQDLIIAFRDVDDIIRYQQMQQKMLDTALQQRDYDVLTGLKNRYCYEKELERYPVRMYETITCIYLDVNGLHEINNSKGHDAGDLMLQRIALYITKIWGESDTFRIGGDEFVVFVLDREKDLIKNDIDGFNKAVETYGYSVSVGYARTTHDDLDMKSFIREAETRMYRAKKDHYKGKNDRRHA